jgi:transposase-like protein
MRRVESGPEGDRQMKRSRYTEDQIIGILKEQEARTPVAELCRKHGMSDETFYTWKNKYGGNSSAIPHHAPMQPRGHKSTFPKMMTPAVLRVRSLFHR